MINDVTQHWWERIIISSQLLIYYLCIYVDTEWHWPNCLNCSLGKRYKPPHWQWGKQAPSYFGFARWAAPLFLFISCLTSGFAFWIHFANLNLYILASRRAFMFVYCDQMNLIIFSFIQRASWGVCPPLWERLTQSIAAHLWCLFWLRKENAKKKKKMKSQKFMSNEWNVLLCVYV